MLCILCVQPAEEFIHIFKPEGIAQNISKTIAKHFWLQPNIDDENQNFICMSCWRTLDMFHSFYLQVERAHFRLQEINTVEEVESTLDQKIKLEIDEEIQLKLEHNTELENDDYKQLTNIKLETEEVIEQPLETYTLHEFKDDTSINLSPIIAPAETDSNECINHDNDADSDTNDWECEYIQSKSKEKKQIESEKLGGTKKNESKDTLSKKKRIPEVSKMDERDEFIAKNLKLSCDVCFVVFPRFAVLKKHYREVHKKRGYAICCGKKMRARCNLVDHLNRHKNPEYFKCEECSKVLSTRQNLNIHMLTHNLRERARNYHCDQCTLSFYTKHLLKRHLHTHISGHNIKCSQCTKFFPTEFLMRRHAQGAHRTRIQNCDQCGISFRSVGALRQHQLEHNDIFQNYQKELADPSELEDVHSERYK